MKRIIFALSWFFITCFFLLGGCFYLSKRFWPTNWWPKSPTTAFTETTTEEITEAEASLSSTLAQTADARATLVANFIERNDNNHTSPLQPYAEWGHKFVAIADEFGLDFRLLPAIARKESTFCKSNIAQKYYNCFGYGVPASGITEAGKFSSYEEGIRVVAASLKKNYLDKGLTDPESIMRKYCPPSDGTWADHLNQWLAEMRYDEKNVQEQRTDNTDLTEFVNE
ncbi:MAG: glucosaminidase domain-containing protein [bacterium]|nr:glucosaminidase domain-containing protein [bacterium]